MRSRRWYVPVALLSLVACSKADKISTGSLSGRAVYAGASDSSGISITAGGYATTTDAAGNYAFDALPVGTVTVMAVAPQSAERTLATTLPVNGGANTAATLTFTPLQALAGQLTVTGANVSGATVTLDGATTTNTDANGIYRFANVTPGEHSLSFSATGAASDGIPKVIYSPDLGGLVSDASNNSALYRLQPFDLQVASRVASINLTNTNRYLIYSPVVSPDGAWVAYQTYSPFIGWSDLYVAPTAGGPPVLVDDRVHSYYQAVRFSPDSRYVAFLHYNAAGTGSYGNWEVWAAPLSGTTVGAKAKVASQVYYTAFDFSPVTSGANGPTLYLLQYDATAAGALTLYERPAGGASIGTALNTWQGVTSFPIISRKQNRIIFPYNGPAAAPVYRIASALAVGGATSPGIVEPTSGTPAAPIGFAFQGFSRDETRWAYAVTGVATPGFKTVPIASATPTPISADTGVSCVAWDSTGGRLVWSNGAAMFERRADATTPAAQLVAAIPWASCPVFQTGDAAVWLAYRDASAVTYLARAAITPGTPDTISVTPLESGADISGVLFARNGSLAFYQRTAAPVVTFYVRPYTQTGSATGSVMIDTATSGGAIVAAPATGGGVLYWRQTDPEATYKNSLFWVGTSGTPTSPVLVASAYSHLSLNPLDETRAVVGSSKGTVSASYPLYTTTYIYNLTGLDTTTGAKRLVLTSAVSTYRGGSTAGGIVDVGATGATTPRIVAFRALSAAPYTFQDGLYVSDP